jgi:hypothetical protein
VQVYAGTAVQVSMSWLDVNGDPVDPASVVLRFGYPGDVEEWTYGVDEELTKVSTGVYTANVPTDNAAPGTFMIVAEGAGTATGATSLTVQIPPL